MIVEKGTVFKLNFKDLSDYKLSNGLSKESNPVNEAINQASSKLNYSSEIENLLERHALYDRAKELITYKWTYNPEAHAIVSNNLVPPHYLSNIKKEQEEQGIPYTWGGFDSLHSRSTNQNWDNFEDALSKEAIIGNVGITPNYLPGTAGLDCSGLISAVLGLESRKPSWYFYYNNDLFEKIAYNKLSLMDTLVKNGHILFYLNKSEHGIRSIETNAIGSQWKVKYFNWSWRALRDNGYSARTYQNIRDIHSEIQEIEK